MKLDTYTDKLSEYSHNLTEYGRNLNAVKLERTASMVGGGTLVALGLLRHSKVSLPLAVLGGGLLYHALTGRKDGRLQETGGNGTATSRAIPHKEGICVEKAITINRSPQELYQWWRNLENLPRWLEFVQSVTMLDNGRSHWVAKAPAGTRVEWDAEIINDVPNELLAWRSIEGADVPNAGSVHFEPAPDGRGTLLKVEMQYNPPAGRIGAAFAKMLGREPEHMVESDLKNLKSLMETGQVPSTYQPHGNPNPLSKFME